VVCVLGVFFFFFWFNSSSCAYFVLLSSFDEPLLVHGFCQFLWLLVINLQFFFVLEGFF